MIDAESAARDDVVRLGIACPTCLSEELEPGKDARIPNFLRCDDCGGVYPIEHGTPQLIDVRTLLRLPAELLAVWQLTQERARPLYASNDPLNCSVRDRDDVRAFRNFMKLAGRDVLDIGSGSFALPGYVQGGDGGVAGREFARFIGLDPIPPISTPDFPLVVGLGERLPFSDNAFDVVIVATSLDHALDVETVLSEIYRTLRPDGAFYSWVGLLEDESILGPEIVAPTLPRAIDNADGGDVAEYLAARDEYERLARHALEHPELAEAATVDAYHFRHYNRQRLMSTLARGRFWPADELVVESSSGETHCFVRAVKASPEEIAAQALIEKVRGEVDWALRPIRALQSDLADARADIARLRAENAEILQIVTRLRDRNGRVLARKVKHRARAAVLDAREALSDASQVSKLASSVVRAATRPKRRDRARGRRVAMLTISQIDRDPRINKVAATLAEHGYAIDIFAPADDDQRTEYDVAPGVRYVREPRTSSTFLYHQEEYRRRALERDFDIVHANDLTTLTTAWILARSRGVPLVYDAHELWTENVELNGDGWVPMSTRTRLVADRWERRVLRDVDLLITVGPSILEEFARRATTKRPPLLLPNYPSLALLDEAPGVSLREACGLTDDAFVTLYMGGIGPLRNIEAVIHAHSRLPENHAFIAMGPGHEQYFDAFNAAVRKAGVEGRAFLLPPVEMHEVVATARDVDCGIVMLKNICKNFYFFYPNKLFEYAAAGLPVAVSNFPDVGDFVTVEQCGVTFDPESPESIATALASLSGNREQARAMGERGRASVIERRNWERASEDLVAAYDALGE